jgi:hypothetical protein
MKKAFVFHKKEMDHFGKAEFFKVKDFELVAIVDIDEESSGPGIHNALEYIYRRTNHIHENWVLDDNGVYPLRHDVRSTSVGDVVMVDNENYLCSFAGWKKIPMM